MARSGIPPRLSPPAVVWSPMADRRKDLLLKLLRYVGDSEGGVWHASLMTTLAEVDAETARWTPAPGRPSIWSFVRHVIVWKKVVMEAFDHGYVDPEPWIAADWSDLPDQDSAWEDDREELARVIRLLEQRVSAADDRLLGREMDGIGGTLAEALMQMATHDAFHAGQIRSLVRLHEALASSEG